MVKESLAHVLPFVYTLFAAKMPPLSGYQFVKNVIDCCNGSLDRLLNVLGNDERPAIEFKASYRPAPGDPSTPDACAWNVLSDVIAIANTSGGCVLLGINNRGEYADGYLDGIGKDRFLRDFQALLDDTKSWHVKSKIITLDEESRELLRECVESIETYSVQEKEVFLVLIKPATMIGVGRHILYQERLEGQSESETKSIFSFRDKYAAKKVNKDANMVSQQMFPAAMSYDHYWKVYRGKWESKPHKKTKLTLWVIFLAFTVAQIALMFDTPRPCPIEKTALLFTGTPLLVTLYLVYRLYVKFAKDIIIVILNAIWLNFMFVFFFYYKAFLYQCETPTWLLWMAPVAVICAISVFLFLSPLLVPLRNQNFTQIPGYPMPDSFVVPHPRKTMESRCADGCVFWEEAEIFPTIYGPWKMQRHKITGFCRVLDPKRVRRCWGSHAEVLPVFEEIKGRYKKKISSSRPAEEKPGEEVRHSCINGKCPCPFAKDCGE